MLYRRLVKDMDFTLLAAVILLLAYSLVVQASATTNMPVGGDPWYYTKRHALYIGVGLVAMFGAMSVDYRSLARWYKVIYVANLLLLAGVLVAGSSAMGAQRWFHVGPFSVQPSEFAKVAIILTLAAHLSRRVDRLERWTDFILPFCHAGLPALLILIQPDLGTSLVFSGILLGMLFIAGAPWTHLAAIYGGALAAAVSWVVLHLKYGVWIPLKAYQLKRLIVFAQPNIDPLGAGYHIKQALVAIGSGQLLGKGLFTGTQSRLRFLPMQHTDFVFAVVGEELGFVGAVALLSLFFVIIWRGARIAAEAKDAFGTLVAAGIVSMFAFHIIVNVGMTVGIMPITGIPLPFVSNGGSAMVTNCIAVGLLLGIHFRRRSISF
ncbi:MAG TPA: rod shape-determining protein RodA [Clostridiales bacterium]|nr:rod shape-determining protein RodA [Clostridiales bacterium]